MLPFLLHFLFQCKESPFPWSIYTNPLGNIPLKDVFPAMVFQRQNTTLFAIENDAENGEKEHRKTSQGAGIDV